MISGTRFVKDLRRRKVPLVILVSVLIIIAAVARVQYASPQDDGSGLKAVAQADRTYVRQLEVIAFSSNGSRGPISGVMWDFGDGTVSEEPNPTHSYEDPGRYNVTLTVSDKADGASKTVLPVAVQREDRESWIPLGRMVNVSPGSDESGAHLLEIGPNLVNPTVVVGFHLERSVGSFSFTIYLEYMSSPDGEESLLLYSEDFTLTGSYFELEQQYTASDLPPEVSTYEADIYARVTMKTGSSAGGSIFIIATYPTEES